MSHKEKMRKAEYKVVTSQTGLRELEQKVSDLINAGWKPLGGLAFNHGYPYQALARVVTTSEKPPENKEPSYISASEAMRRVDDLT